MTAQEPGWYADPGGTARVRWWDGEHWTRWLSRDPAAGPPGVAPTLTPPGTTADPPVPAPAAAAPDNAEPGPPEGSIAASPPRDRTVRLPVAVAVVVGVLLVAVVGLGAVTAATAQRLPSGPAMDPPPSAAAVAVQFDAAARTASVAELQVTLAGAPYECGERPEPFEPVFTSFELCSTPVHRNYDGHGGSWTATTGVGLLAEDLVVPGDIQQTGDRVFSAVRTRFFAGEQTTVTDDVSQPTGLTADDRSTSVAGEVRYRIAGVPSRYDRVLVVVVELADGSHAAWISARPEKTPAATLKVLDASIGTLRVR